jgi:hypothetical protein
MGEARALMRRLNGGAQKVIGNARSLKSHRLEVARWTQSRDCNVCAIDEARARGMRVEEVAVHDRQARGRTHSLAIIYGEPVPGRAVDICARCCVRRHQLQIPPCQRTELSRRSDAWPRNARRDQFALRATHAPTTRTARMQLTPDATRTGRTAKPCTRSLLVSVDGRPCPGFGPIENLSAARSSTVTLRLIRLSVDCLTTAVMSNRNARGRSVG